MQTEKLISSTIKKLLSSISLLMLLNLSLVFAQNETRWMSIGSYQNWYSEMGSEIEWGLEREMQYGMRYPALYKHTDMQVSRGLWVGTTDFTDDRGTFFPYKVVHVGPRVTGETEFFPQQFIEKSNLDPQPVVLVDGIPSNRFPVKVDEVDQEMPYDRMIVNKTTNQLGLEMERRIFQFSQSFHDNYIVNEYVFTNTGNTDDDEAIELPNNTLTDLVFYFTYRLAPSARTRYLIGNATGWGINTMIDARGDGLGDKYGDSPDEDFRAQYAWHGYYPWFFPPHDINADNIGGPIFFPYEPFTAIDDTSGRLGAAQFAGILTVHADKSAQDSTDDPNQPSTVSWEESDNSLFSTGEYDFDRMRLEYNLMTKGLDNDGSHGNEDRHAYKTEPTGYPGWIEPENDPSLGTPGGFSFANGYGPYTLVPGESVRIVWAEAAASISHEQTIEFGRQLKNGEITNKEKNERVFWGRDSLFQTFRRILDAAENDFEIPQPPLPPKNFNISSGANNITLSWETYNNSANLKGFEIYRAAGKFDNAYHRIPEPGYIFDVSEREYQDTSLVKGVDYYYYIISVGDASDNNSVGLTPAGALKSSRFYTQTYDPAYLDKEVSVKGRNQTPLNYSLRQNYPNPFNPATTIEFAIPESGFTSLKIYDVLGKEVSVLVEEDLSSGKYKFEFNAEGLSSGMYVYKLTSGSTVLSEKMLLLK